MNPKKPRDKRELCYPFIFETSFKCDFEIATDELCCQVGAVLSHLAPDADTEPMLVDLAALQRLIYNLNGSVRGKLGIFDADLEWLKARYDHYNEASRGSVTGFVLPQGPQPIPTLHLCRCGSKKVVRLLGQLLLRAHRLPQAALAGAGSALRQHQLLMAAEKAFVFHEV